MYYPVVGIRGEMDLGDLKRMAAGRRLQAVLLLQNGSKECTLTKQDLLKTPKSPKS